VVQDLWRPPLHGAPEWNLVDVYAATIPEFPFKAGVHVNYAQAVLRNEGWPSQVEGLPSGTRGTVETVPE